MDGRRVAGRRAEVDRATLQFRVRDAPEFEVNSVHRRRFEEGSRAGGRGTPGKRGRGQARVQPMSGGWTTQSTASPAKVLRSQSIARQIDKAAGSGPSRAQTAAARVRAQVTEAERKSLAANSRPEDAAARTEDTGPESRTALEVYDPHQSQHSQHSQQHRQEPRPQTTAGRPETDTATDEHNRHSHTGGLFQHSGGRARGREGGGRMPPRTAPEPERPSRLPAARAQLGQLHRLLDHMLTESRLNMPLDRPIAVAMTRNALHDGHCSTLDVPLEHVAEDVVFGDLIHHAFQKLERVQAYYHSTYEGLIQELEDRLESAYEEIARHKEEAVLLRSAMEEGHMLGAADLNRIARALQDYEDRSDRSISNVLHQGLSSASLAEALASELSKVQKQHVSTVSALQARVKTLSEKLRLATEANEDMQDEIDQLHDGNIELNDKLHTLQEHVDTQESLDNAASKVQSHSVDALRNVKHHKRASAADQMVQQILSAGLVKSYPTPFVRGTQPVYALEKASPGPSSSGDAATRNATDSEGAPRRLGNEPNTSADFENTGTHVEVHLLGLQRDVVRWANWVLRRACITTIAVVEKANVYCSVSGIRQIKFENLDADMSDGINYALILQQIEMDHGSAPPDRTIKQLLNIMNMSHPVERCRIALQSIEGISADQAAAIANLPLGFHAFMAHLGVLTAMLLWSLGNPAHMDRDLADLLNAYSRPPGVGREAKEDAMEEAKNALLQEDEKAAEKEQENDDNEKEDAEEEAEALDEEESEGDGQESHANEPPEGLAPLAEEPEAAAAAASTSRKKRRVRKAGPKGKGKGKGRGKRLRKRMGKKKSRQSAAMDLARTATTVDDLLKSYNTSELPTDTFETVMTTIAQIMEAKACVDMEQRQTAVKKLGDGARSHDLRAAGLSHPGSHMSLAKVYFRPMGLYCLDFLIMKYGLKKMALKQLAIMAITVLDHVDSSPRCRLFARLAGIHTTAQLLANGTGSDDADRGTPNAEPPASRPKRHLGQDIVMDEVLKLSSFEGGSDSAQPTPKTIVDNRGNVLDLTEEDRAELRELSDSRVTEDELLSVLATPGACLFYLHLLTLLMPAREIAARLGTNGMTVPRESLDRILRNEFHALHISMPPCLAVSKCLDAIQERTPKDHVTGMPQVDVDAAMERIMLLYPVEMKLRELQLLHSAARDMQRLFRGYSSRASIDRSQEEQNRLREESDIRHLFFKYDKNADGVLSFSEFSAMLRELRPGLGQTRCMQLFQEALQLSEAERMHTLTEEEKNEADHPLGPDNEDAIDITALTTALREGGIRRLASSNAQGSAAWMDLHAADEVQVGEGGGRGARK